MRRWIAIGCTAVVALWAFAAGAGNLDLDKLAGLYVNRFTNADISGRHFPGADVLELVKVTPTTAFFRTHLDFFNGHECQLSGIAEADGASLVYRDPAQQCELHIDVANGKLTFDDKDYHCREQSCGMRGGYSGIAFALKSRHPIAGIAKLKASSDYAQALKEFDALQQH
jgi:hypothetical protein